MASNRQTRCAVILAAVAAATATATGCDVLYTFDRELPVARGAIFGEAVRGEVGGEKAAYSQVNMMGVGLVRQAGSNGAFALTDLNAGTYVLRINDDDDGDGFPERSRLVATSLVVADRPDAFGFGSGSQLVSTSLGEVVVEGTGTVSGQVTIDDGNGVQVPPAAVGLGGRALIFRDIVTELTGEQALQLGADAETHVDAAGRYLFDQALSGEFFLVITLHQGAGAVRNETVFVSEPQSLSLDLNGSVTAEDITVDAIDANLEDSVRTVEVLVGPPLADGGEPYAIFGPPGRPLSTCQSPRPSVAQFAYERIVNATASTISRLEGAPLGVWDVRYCGAAQFVDPDTGNLESEATLGSATLYSLVIAPSVDGLSTVLTGPVVLTRELDPCIRRVCSDGSPDCDDAQKELIRDCDGDGRIGIAPFDPTDPTIVSTWATCADQCGVLTGVDAVEAECAVGGVVYDCDDDGDQQSDGSEPPACYGPGLGDDRDGDGLCSGEDAYPTCTANTAADCDAGVIDVTPATPEEFGGDAVIDAFDPDYGVDGLLVLAAPQTEDDEVEFVSATTLSTGRVLVFTETRTNNLVGVGGVQTRVAIIDPAINNAIDSFPLFTEFAAEDAVFIPQSGASVENEGVDVHFFAGTGFGSGQTFDERLPHVCRAIEGEQPERVAADTTYGFFGCTNALGETPPPGLREFNAVAIVNQTNACAAGADDEGVLYVQCYDANADPATVATFNYSEFGDSLGFQSFDFVDVVKMVPSGPNELVIFAEFNGNLAGGGPSEVVSAYGVFDFELVEISSDLIRIELDPEIASTVDDAIVVDVVQVPGDTSLYKLIGRAVSGPVEAIENDLFLMDFQTAGVIGPILSTSFVNFESNGHFEEFRSMRAVDATHYIISGGIDFDSPDSEGPFAARWDLTIEAGNVNPEIVRTVEGNTARSLGGHYSETQESFELGGAEFIVGLRAEDQGIGEGGEPLIGPIDVFAAKLAPRAGQDTAAPDQGEDPGE